MYCVVKSNNWIQVNAAGWKMCTLLCHLNHNCICVIYTQSNQIFPQSSSTPWTPVESLNVELQKEWNSSISCFFALLKNQMSVSIYHLSRHPGQTDQIPQRGSTIPNLSCDSFPCFVQYLRNLFYSEDLFCVFPVMPGSNSSKFHVLCKVKVRSLLIVIYAQAKGPVSINDPCPTPR